MSRVGRPDIVVDRPAGLVLVEVKSRIDKRDLAFFFEQLQGYLHATHAQAAYTLLVDASRMTFFRGTDPEQSVWSEDTSSVLARYDPTLSENPIFENYLASLVQRWLNDLALLSISELPEETKTLPDDLRELLAA